MRYSAGHASCERLEARRLFSTVLPTDYDQYVVELINHERSNPAAEAALYQIDLNEGLAPGTITSAPKQPLAINLNLMSSATLHSQVMLETQTFSHTEADGSTPYDRELAAGYDFMGTWGWGENIAYIGNGSQPTSDTPTLDAENQNLFVDSTEADRGHRLNLLDPNFKEVGVGVVDGTFDGLSAVMMTQDFANTTANSFLTGVAYDDASGNGMYEPGEGLGGVTISAVNTSTNAVFSTATWSTGGYTLQLPPGTYAVSATGGGLAATIDYGSVTIGTLNVEVDFTSQMAVAVAAANPTPAPTPTPVATTTTTPTPTPAPTSTSTSTPTSTPTVTSSNPASGSTQSTTTTPTSTSTTPTTPTPTTTPVVSQPVAMGTASVTGRIYDDARGLGRQARGDSWLSGVTVFLNADGSTQYQAGDPTAVTLSDGSYEFANVFPGTFHVEIQSPTGWRITTPTLNQHVTVSNGQTTSVHPMGMTQSVIVAGRLVNDSSSSVSRSTASTGLGGWKVFVDVAGTGVYAAGDPSAITRSDGSFSLTLPPGSYQVLAVPRRHFSLVSSLSALQVGPLAAGSVTSGLTIDVRRS